VRKVADGQPSAQVWNLEVEEDNTYVANGIVVHNCQEYSYMAMPWNRGKQIAAALHGEANFPEEYTGSRTVQDLRALFDCCFRIQREASIAAGNHIPMVVENVKGAQPWVGQARANFGSFFLWGDIGMANGNIVVPGAEFGDVLRAPSRSSKKKVDMHFHQFEQTGQPGGSFQSAAVGVKVGTSNGKRFDERPRGSVAGHREGTRKQPVWFNDDKRDAAKCGGDWFGSGKDCSLMRNMSSGSSARKAASAMIAKIPEPLSRYLARAFNLERVIARGGIATRV
jgi:hypothetical protein